MNNAAATVAANIARTIAAGPDAFNARTRDRLGGSSVVIIRSRWVATHRVCCVCGLDVDVKTPDGLIIPETRSESGHLVPRGFFGARDGGWVEGNIALMCWQCNKDADNRVFTGYDLVRPDIALAPFGSVSKNLRNKSEISQETIRRRAARNW